MNIIDLAWIRFYLYDERHDIGVPLFGASISMSLFITLYILGIVVFFKNTGLYEFTNYPSEVVPIISCLFIGLFMMRHWNKKIRARRLSLYHEYKDKYPQKTKIRFLVFIIIPIVLMIADLIITNIISAQMSCVSCLLTITMTYHP